MATMMSHMVTVSTGRPSLSCTVMLARSRPDSAEALAGISGVGAKKLQAYGQEILRVLKD